MTHHFSTPREVRQLLDQALTCRELIDILEQYESDVKIVFASDFGDIGHTLQALPIRVIEHLNHDLGSSLVASAYSNSGVAIESFDDSDDQLEFEVIVLS